jgi:hypothetical protein
MRFGSMAGKDVVVAVFVLVAVFMVMFAGVCTDDESSDAIVIDTMTIEEGEVYSDDVTVTNCFVVEGTYSGTLTLRNGSTDMVSLEFSSVSGFTACVNSGDPYITGSLTSALSAGSFEVLSGSITLGNDVDGFTGTVTGNSGETEFNSIVGAVVSLNDSELFINGDVSAAYDVGFGTVASFTLSASSAYTGDEAIAISGTLSNEILGNSMDVLSKNFNIYQLRGTLNYIDRNGGSAAGVLFDMIVGDLNECTHAIVVSTSSPVTTGDRIIALGGDKYLICVQSGMDDNMIIGGKTISFAGLVMGDASTVITPSLSGCVGSIDITDDAVIGNLTVGPSVNMHITRNSVMSVLSSSDVVIEGSLMVSGTADVTYANSFTTRFATDEEGEIFEDGTVSSVGSLTIGSLNTSNVHGAYYNSGSDRVFTTLSSAINKQTDGKAYICRSFVQTSSLTVGSSMTIVNDGTFFVSSGVLLVNNGAFVNSDSDSGLIVTYDGEFNSSSAAIDNSGYVMAYGLFVNKGAFGSKAYADISNYNNITTKLACLPVMLENVSSGEITLYRDVEVVKTSELPYGVTLYVMDDNDLTIGSGATFVVKGKLDVQSTVAVVGAMSVSGVLEIESGGSVTVDGTLTVSGSLNNAGTATVDGTLQIGTAPSRLPYINNTVLTGKIVLGPAALAVVYGKDSGFDPSEILDYTRSTVFYFEDDVYATEYASVPDVKIELLTPKIIGTGFAQWLDPDGDSIQGVHYVGDYNAVYADINTSTYAVTLVENEGIIWVLDDVTEYGHGGTVTVAYGSHYLTIKVEDGYSGTPTILRITPTGSQVVEQGKEFLVVEDCEFKVEGVYVNGGGGDTDNGLITILSIIIVVALALIAVMTFLLMRKRHKSAE